MAWARIDDSFDDHPKVLALLDMEDGAAAIGLWTLCLTYAHRNTRRKGKTPGHLPATLPRRFLGAEGRGLAALLVKVGLWDEVDDGWMIHDFADYLPGKEVSAARSAAGKKGAAARWGNGQPDGNLPSVDGKPDGKVMAADGNEMAGAADPTAGAADPSPGETAHNKEPSDDGNLPSGSHADDGKSMASDGSRARARRDRVDVRTTVLFPDPGPTPVPPSAGAVAPDAGEPVTAQTIVGEWIERCAQRPPQRVIGQLSKEIKTLLVEGIHPDHVRRGVAVWMTKGMHPSALASVVNEVMNAVPRELRPTGTDNRSFNCSGPRLAAQDYDNPRL